MWSICIPAVFGAIVGSWMGSHLALLISESVLKIAMLIVLPIILFYVLRSNALKGNEALPWERNLNRLHGRLMASVSHRMQKLCNRCRTPHTNMIAFTPITSAFCRLSRQHPATSSLESRPESYSRATGEKPL